MQAKEDLRFLGEVGFAHYHRDITMIEWADRFIESDSTVCIFDPSHAASIRIARKVGYAEAGKGKILEPANAGHVAA